MTINKFFLYSFISICDKLLLFLLPASILYFFNDKALYNEIEFIYSFATIIYIFTDGGIKNYVLAFYRKHKNKKKFITENKSYVNTLALYYSIILITTIIVFSFFITINLLFFLIFLRVVFLMINNYLKVHYALLNKQLHMYKLTLFTSIGTLLYIGYSKYFEQLFSLQHFFIFQILVVISCIIYNTLKNNLIKFGKVKKIFLTSYKNSIYLILNASIFFIIMHYAKIYSYNFLPEEEMTKVSFILRIMLAIQVIHGIYTNYYYEKFFRTSIKKFDFKIIFNYLFLLFISVAIIVLLYPFITKLFNLNYKVDIMFFLILGYTTLWCVAAFFEQYLNKSYKNKYILLYSLFSLTVYLGVILFLVNTDMLIRICIAMLASILVYFILIFKKVLSIKHVK